MSKGKRALVIAALFFSIASASHASELKDDWSDFLHYKKIGRFDLAKDSTCKVSLHGAEPWPWATRVKIEELFGVKAYDEFGMTEFLGPGMTCECEARTEDMPQKMHAWADHLLAECINPYTGEPVGDGEDG